MQPLIFINFGEGEVRHNPLPKQRAQKESLQEERPQGERRPPTLGCIGKG
jgi:hypothetical protein